MDCPPDKKRIRQPASRYGIVDRNFPPDNIPVFLSVCAPIHITALNFRICTERRRSVLKAARAFIPIPVGHISLHCQGLCRQHRQKHTYTQHNRYYLLFSFLHPISSPYSCCITVPDNCPMSSPSGFRRRSILSVLLCYYVPLVLASKIYIILSSDIAKRKGLCYTFVMKTHGTVKGGNYP